jgi:hypothetical protein
VTHLSLTTNLNAARDDDDHIIVVPPDDHIIVVPPRGPDDCVVALPDGSRWWVSLPPEVRALVPHSLRADGACERLPPNGLLTRKPSTARTIAAAKKAGASSVTTPDGCVIRFNEPAGDERNEWDTVLPHVKN